MFLAVVAGWVPEAAQFVSRTQDARARVALPATADLFHVGYVELARNADGRLVVFTDAHAEVQMNGRFRVILRDRDTGRHAFTPEWSDWIIYEANPSGTRYRQPETFQWWAGLGIGEFFEPPARNWAMETCWQARVVDDQLGLVELEPVCITSLIDREHPPQEIAP